jgi:hypothetical protein
MSRAVPSLADKELESCLSTPKILEAKLGCQAQAKIVYKKQQGKFLRQDQK